MAKRRKVTFNYKRDRKKLRCPNCKSNLLVKLIYGEIQCIDCLNIYTTKKDLDSLEPKDKG